MQIWCSRFVNCSLCPRLNFFARCITYSSVFYVTYNLIEVCLCTQQDTEDILIIWRKLGYSCFNFFFPLEYCFP